MDRVGSEESLWPFLNTIKFHVFVYIFGFKVRSTCACSNSVSTFERLHGKVSIENANAFLEAYQAILVSQILKAPKTFSIQNELAKNKNLLNLLNRQLDIV